MKLITQKKIMRGIRILTLAAMAAAIIGFALPTMAAPPLPREPMPKPHVSGPPSGIPKPPVHIGTRPKFDPSNIGALPDLKIVRVKPKLHPQAINVCKTGQKSFGGMLLFDVTVKNVGKGIADLGKLYAFNVISHSSDGLKPSIDGVKQYYYNVRNPETYTHGRPNPLIRPGQTFKVETNAFVNNNEFPSSQYHKLAGKSRHFIIKLGDRKPHDLRESNYNNNAKKVSFTFPRNFCQQNVVHGGVSQTAPVLKPHLVIQSIRTQLRRPYECRTDGPTFADGDLVIKNTGGDFIPDSRLDAFYIRGQLSVGSNRLSLYSADHLRSRIPAGATRHVRFAMTGTAGLLHTPTPPMSVLAGRTVSISVRSDFGVTGNRNSSIHFPAGFCTAGTSGGISASIGSGQTIRPNITGFQFAGGKNCVSPGGTFTIKGNAFGNSAGGRTVELGGNGMGVNLSIQSWGNRSIRVQLPRTARLQYRKNYWVRIQAPAVAGSARTLSNLKRGVVLCPPTVHVGTSGSSGSQSAHQNGSNSTPTGLPDLEISAMHFDNAECFQPSTGPGERGRFNIPLLRGTVTVKNKGFATYTHRKNVPFAIFLSGARNILMPLRSGSHGSRYALVATMGSGNGPGVWNDIKIDSGESREFPVYLHLYHSLTAHRIARGDDKTSFDRQDARSVLGKSASVEINIGPRKHYRLNKTAALESHYENNSRRVLISFPSLACGSRL